MRRLRWVAAVAGLMGSWAFGQTATTLVEPPAPLLPPTVQGIARTGDAIVGDDPAKADAALAEALKEDGLIRFAQAQYGPTRVEALQFNDATGAYSAFTLYTRPGAKSAPEIAGSQEGVLLDGRTILLAQTVVLIAEKDAQARTLAAIVLGLPKIGGPRRLPPLLPTFFPAKGLVAHSLRYSIGPASYAAMGGTLSAGKLGWEKSAEAATAEYADRRGKESFTLLLYPTPQIAGEHTRALEAQTAGKARVRRKGELVIVADGNFSADDAQNMVENIHLRNEVTFDKPLPPKFETEIRKTYSLLTSIAILSGAGALAAIVLGLSLGGGRALIRKLQGKDAATEAEFLSLHLDNQNPRPKFDPPGS